MKTTQIAALKYSLFTTSETPSPSSEIERIWRRIELYDASICSYAKLCGRRFTSIFEPRLLSSCQADAARLARPGRMSFPPRAISVQDMTTLPGIIFAPKGIHYSSLEE
jgi:hypothetical protein